MQNAGFVGFLVALLFAFGLNAVGLFEISFSMGSGQAAQGLWGSFSHGALITLVSTPCSAPILGGATAAALAKDAAWYETVILFSSIGLGLSLPVLLVGFIPGAIKIFPKPGQWMNGFKLLVGFTLFGAAIFYFGTLQEQLTTSSANDFLWFLLSLTAALWWFEAVRTGQSQGAKRLVGLLLVPVIIAGSGYIFLTMEERADAPAAAVAKTTETATQAADVTWQLYTEKKHEQASKERRPILIDFTASWCVNCKAFKKTYLEVDKVKRVLADTGILPLTVDLTKDKTLLETTRRCRSRWDPRIRDLHARWDLRPLSEGPTLSNSFRITSGSQTISQGGLQSTLVSQTSSSKRYVVHLLQLFWQLALNMMRCTHTQCSNSGLNRQNDQNRQKPNAQE